LIRHLGREPSYAEMLVINRLAVCESDLHSRPDIGIKERVEIEKMLGAISASSA
jgi:hypothetical protein